MNTNLQASVCRSDFEIATFLDDIQIDGFKGLTSLPAAAFSLDSADADMKAQRGELITAVRAGRHLELKVDAITWRQRPAANRRGLRLLPERLAARVGSWRGKPFLVDHNTNRVMESSKGTILSSKLLEESANISAFHQSLNVVKPDAVIGFLDGTLRSFSISWFPIGPVLCTVHGVDVSAPGSCGCWPLDSVLIDGKSKIVQYEFQDYEGKETSGVVVGAVFDTSVEGVRAQLSAELNLHPRQNTPKERKTMAFPKLAAALALTVLGEADEDSAVSAVTALRARASSAEVDAATLRAENTRLITELAAQTALANAAGAQAIDAMIVDAYKAGKLAYGKDAAGANTPDALEDLLRAHGKTAGRDALAAKISGMKVVIPVGQGSTALAAAGDPARTEHTPPAAKPTLAQLQAAADSLGVPVGPMAARYGIVIPGGAS